MVKEIQICEYREKGKLSACKEVAWAWCQGNHTAWAVHRQSSGSETLDWAATKPGAVIELAHGESAIPIPQHIYFCADHLQQCQTCGGIFCEACLGTHGCPSQVFMELE